MDHLFQIKDLWSDAIDLFTSPHCFHEFFNIGVTIKSTWIICPFKIISDKMFTQTFFADCDYNAIAISYESKCQWKLWAKAFFLFDLPSRCRLDHQLPKPYLPILETLWMLRVSQILQVYCNSNFSVPTRFTAWEAPSNRITSESFADIPLKEDSPIGGKHGISVSSSVSTMSSFSEDEYKMFFSWGLRLLWRKSWLDCFTDKLVKAALLTKSRDRTIDVLINIVVCR